MKRHDSIGSSKIVLAEMGANISLLTGANNLWAHDGQWDGRHHYYRDNYGYWDNDDHYRHYILCGTSTTAIGTPAARFACLSTWINGTG